MLFSKFARANWWKAPVIAGVILAHQSPLFLDLKIPVAEFIKHNVLSDLWVAIDGKVYDLTQFAKLHPGGVNVLYKYAGKEATEAFGRQHGKSIIDILPPDAYKGQLDGILEKPVKTEEELRIEALQASKPPINAMFNVNDFEYVAKKVMPKEMYTFFATGSDDEATLRECHAAYSRVFFRPRILTNTNTIDLLTIMLGHKVKLPIYVTAFAGQAYLTDGAERTLAKIANDKGMMYMCPRLSSIPVGEVLKQLDEGSQMWSQCCVHWGDPEIALQVEELNKYPEITAIFITTDAALGGNREKDFKVRLEETNSPELARYSSQTKPYPAMTWDMVMKVKNNTTKSVVLKGVQRSEDVLKACELGLDGVVLSNHGGRQLDYSQPPLEVLAETMPLLRKQPYYDPTKFNVFIDGGVRRGNDVIKALALGASGVGMGKAFAYALASYGEDGARKLVDLIEAELVRNMKLLGASQVRVLNESFLNLKGLYNRTGYYDDSYMKNYDRLPAPQFQQTESVKV